MKSVVVVCLFFSAALLLGASATSTEGALEHIALDVVVNLAAGTIHHAIEGGVGQCATRLMGDLDSTKAMNVQQELLNWCNTRELQWDPASHANDEKQWHVWSSLGGGILGLKKCDFNVQWRPKVGGQVFDCSEAGIRTKIGTSMNDAQKNAKVAELKRKFPRAHFTYHITGVNLDVFRCSLSSHTGFVHVFASVPAVAAPWEEHSPRKPTDAQIQAYEANPAMYLNIELWTYGDCSGWKAPGVSWIFTYKIDFKTAKITVDWTKDANNRPVPKTPTFITEVSRETGRPEPIQVKGYTENTKSICGMINACHVGHEF